MTDHPNYRAIHVPEGKRNGHEEELTYAERRAYILERLEDVEERVESGDGLGFSNR